MNEKQKPERRSLASPPADTAPPQAIKLGETARRLGVSRNTVYAAAKRGQIPTIRIGRLLLVPVAALDRLLNADAA